MGNRIFVGVVFMLWLGTMSWLMVARILPPFFQGEPPSHGVLIRDAPVCWQIEYDGRRVGYAVSQAVPGALGTTEVHSRVKLDGINLGKLAPQWMSTLVRGLGEISLDTRTTLVLDTLGSLSSFDTRVWLNDLPLVMKAVGKVDGPELLLKLQTGEVAHESRHPVPTSALLASELIPEPKLLHVYVGRRWQQEVYSPFRPPTSPMEILQAEVVDETWIEQHGQGVRVRKIEYRSLPPAGVAASKSLRSVVWVDDEGTVMRQDVFLMDARLRFERATEPHMLKLASDLLDLESVATIVPPHTSP